MKNESRIPMTFRRRWQYIAAGAGPVAAWIAATIIAAAIVTRESQVVTVRGLSDEPRAIVTPTIPGRLLSMPVPLLDPVNQGEILAVMDDAPLRAELEIIRAEAALLKATTAAELDRLRVENANLERAELIEYRRLAIDLSSAQLSVLEREVDLHLAGIELDRLQTEEARLSALSEGGVASAAEMDLVRFGIASTRKFLESSESVMTEARTQLENSRARLEEFRADSGIASIDEDLVLAAFAAEADLIATRLRHLETSLPGLVLRSPFSGSVVVTYAHPGSDVTPGMPIAEIVPTETSILVAWLPEDSTLRPRHGDRALVTTMNHRGKPLEGAVSRVATTIQPLPLKLLRNPQMPEYGMPVRIELDGQIIPTGQRLQVQFRR